MRVFASGIGCVCVGGGGGGGGVRGVLNTMLILTDLKQYSSVDKY